MRFTEPAHLLWIIQVLKQDEKAWGKFVSERTARGILTSNSHSAAVKICGILIGVIGFMVCGLFTIAVTQDAYESIFPFAKSI